MLRQGRAVLLAFSLCASSPVCSALLPSHPSLRHPSLRSVEALTCTPKYSKLAAWRGGAIEGSGGGGGSGPTMNLQLGLVRVAGYGIIAGSLCLKTPQIARVWQAKSLVGLAPTSIYADVFLFATSVIYHLLKRNPIRAYGETVVILVQTMIMVGLLWRFGGTESDASLANGVEALNKKRSPGGGLVGRIAIVLGSIAACAACLQYLPEPLWGLLVVVSTPTIIAVQAPQIIKNFRQKHTGELAVLTVVLSFVGSCIRVGTTIADLGGDRWLLTNYVLGAATNLFMLTQVYIYRAKTAVVRRRVIEMHKPVASPAA